MSQTNLKRILLTSAILGTLALTGCSGGGSSSGGGGSSSISVNGVAAKGIIKNATVTAYELVDGTPNQVGAANTTETGDYSLTLDPDAGYNGGPLKLVLTAKEGDGTDPANTSYMKCDVAAGCGSVTVGGTPTTISFGDWYPLASTFTLKSYQPGAAPGTTVSAQITPLTNMVAARVEAGGAVTDANVALAISEVSSAFHVDLNSKPVDITNPPATVDPEALKYAAVNAGVGAVALANAGGFEAGLTAVADAFNDGQFDSTDSVSITAIVAAVNTETTNITTNIVTDTAITNSLTNTVATLETETASGTYNPEPNPATLTDPVAQAKALVSQTRAWGTELATLQSPATAFGVDIDTAASVLNSNSGVLTGVLMANIGGAVDAIATAAASANGLQATSYPYNVEYWDGTQWAFKTGSVTVSDNSGYLMMTITPPSPAELSGVTISNAAATTTIPSSVLGTQNPALFSAVSLTANASASMSTASGPASVDLKDMTVTITPKSGQAIQDNMDGTEFASWDLSGAIDMAANGVAFSGNGNLKFIANSVSTDQPMSLSELAVSGTFTGSKGTTTGSASVKFNNAATFDVIGLITHQPEVWVNQWVPGDALGVAAAFSNTTGGDTLLYGYYDSWSNQTCGEGLSSGYQCLPGDAFGISAAIQAQYPNALSVQNVWANYDSNWGTSYSAMVSYPDFETASNYANATVTLSSSLALDGFPQASLTVTANRTAYSVESPVEGTVVATLGYAGQSMTFRLDSTTTPESGTLTVTNPDGVELVINGAVNSTATGVTGSVSVDGKLVGTIDSSSGIPLIRYSDGTFESLN